MDAMKTRPINEVLKDVPPAVLQWIESAQNRTDERRTVVREPFFRPVTLERSKGGKVQEVSCFSRDISPKGIGLLHNFTLEENEEVVLTIHSDCLGRIRVRSRIKWCEACGEGWHISGAQFLELPI
jgi:hypothetical protein